MVERIRRVVMGQDAHGRSQFSHVEDVAARPGMEVLHDVWGWDALPVLPITSADPYDGMSVLPDGIGSARVMVLTLPATADADWSQEEQENYLVDGLTPEVGDIPGLHTTDSIDVGFVLCGRVEVLGSGGVSQVLEPGDVYIQNGAPHAWRNAGDVDAKLAAVVIGVQRRSS